MEAAARGAHLDLWHVPVILNRGWLEHGQFVDENPQSKPPFKERISH